MKSDSELTLQRLEVPAQDKNVNTNPRTTLRTRRLRLPHASVCMVIVFGLVYFPLFVLPYAQHSITFYDEAVFYHSANRMLHGEQLYRDFYGRMNRPPGITWFIMPHIVVWGHTARAIISGRLTEMALFVMMGAMLFAIARRLAGPWVGALATILLWTNQSAMRSSAYVMSELPAAFFMLLAVYLLICSKKRIGPALAGAAVAAAAFFRIEAIAFVALLGVVSAMRPGLDRWRRVLAMFVGCMAPWVVYLVALQAEHVLKEFFACVFLVNQAESAIKTWNITWLSFAQMLNAVPFLSPWWFSGLDITKLSYLVALRDLRAGMCLGGFTGIGIWLLFVGGILQQIRRPTEPSSRPIVIALGLGSFLFGLFYLFTRRFFTPRYGVLPAMGLSLYGAIGFQTVWLFWRSRRRQTLPARFSSSAGLVIAVTALLCSLPLPLSLPVHPFQATVPDVWSVDDQVIELVKERGAAGSVVTDSPQLLFLMGQTTSFWAAQWLRDCNAQVGLEGLYPKESYQVESLVKSTGGKLVISQWNYAWLPDQTSKWDAEGYTFINKHYKLDSLVGYDFLFMNPNQPNMRIPQPLGYRIFTPADQP